MLMCERTPKTPTVATPAATMPLPKPCPVDHLGWVPVQRREESAHSGLPETTGVPLVATVPLVALPSAFNLSLLAVDFFLQDWRIPNLIYPTKLVVTELVGEALDRTGQADPDDILHWNELHLISLHLTLTRDVLLIQIQDADPQPPSPKSPEVDAVVDRSGYYHLPDPPGGKVVWVEVPRGPSAAPLPRRTPQQLPEPQQPLSSSEDQIQGDEWMEPDLELMRRVLEGLRRLRGW